MPVSKTLINHFPRFKKSLKSLYDTLQGMPMDISPSKITKEVIRECVGKANPTILDIGCNRGGHSLWFLEMFESPNIFCFEPDPRAIRRFKNGVGQQSNIHLFEMALSDRIGEITFYQSGGQRNDC